MRAQGSMIEAYRVCLDDEDDFDGWRDAARGLAAADVPAAAISWQVAGKDGDLFAAPATRPPPSGPSFPVPRRLIDLAKAVI